MSTTTMASILNNAVSSLGSMFATYLPVIIPVAVALAGLFFIIHWLFGSSRRR